MRDLFIIAVCLGFFACLALTLTDCAGPKPSATALTYAAEVALCTNGDASPDAKDACVDGVDRKYGRPTKDGGK